MIKKFTLRLDKETMYKLRIVARRENRSINGQINYWMEEYVSTFEKEYGKIEE